MHGYRARVAGDFQQRLKGILNHDFTVLDADRPDGDDAVRHRIQSGGLAIQHHEPHLHQWAHRRPMRFELLPILKNGRGFIRRSSPIPDRRTIQAGAEMDWKPLLRTCRSYGLSNAGGNSAPEDRCASPTRPCCHSTVRKVADASSNIAASSGCIRLAMANRSSVELPNTFPAAMPNTRATSTSGFSAVSSKRKTDRFLAGFVNHGILEKRQRRKCPKAIVGGDVQELATDGGENVRFQLPAQGFVSGNRAQVKERPGRGRSFLRMGSPIHSRYRPFQSDIAAA